MATVQQIADLLAKVKLSLGLATETDSDINSQIEQLVNSAIHLFSAVKGVNETLLFSDTGIMLVTIYVSDVWRTGGEFKFSPATDMLLESLYATSRGMAYDAE